MPFSDEFKKLRRHFGSLYNDKAKADTFAFKFAFDKDIPTIQDIKRKFKRQ